ncbi:DNA-binding protein [Elizabethkingia anophelis]|uniref:helix-turn-helix domain-containing protein n=1 Tax=Elizabethkingia anophelis TaxID=1117645 RepID=UPI0004E2D6A3|nr:helix-turn-helix transcriptional regulator [Elizabethkingia anophelis]KFC33517.1 DNA-binding protein [Elizabethkingia anophelis]
MENNDLKEQVLKSLGERIKALRIKKGYTSYEYFAYEHNISRAQFGRYERGEDLRFSTLARIITAFDMTFEEFFSEGFSLENNAK